MNHQGAALQADAVYMFASEQKTKSLFLDIRAGPYMGYALGFSKDSGRTSYDTRQLLWPRRAHTVSEETGK